MKDFIKIINMAAEHTEGTESDIEKAYKLGIRMGIKMIEDKIERQCELGKPILANDNLYWLKDAKQNLIDIMDDLEADYMLENWGMIWMEIWKNMELN